MWGCERECVRGGGLRKRKEWKESESVWRPREKREGFKVRWSQAGCSGEPMENEEREGLQLLDGFRVSFRVLWCGWWWAGR